MFIPLPPCGKYQKESKYGLCFHFEYGYISTPYNGTSTEITEKAEGRAIQSGLVVVNGTRERSFSVLLPFNYVMMNVS